MREGMQVTVSQTPLLGVVRRISAPPTTLGEYPIFKASGGNIYGSFSPLLGVLLVVATLGLLPGRSPEMRVNTAVVGFLLAVVALVVLIWF
ncbi:hypothetical protein [Hymenobacter cellulosilyticus]|uniref:Uncharacterized protein n=1 Tax=Hymenobacter cellulosilyticus TaxID=2932248 RepID=A0A8T9QB79_9BACT|nr:hypothetical protein [Hymenobacter cellulosilyticus]UOQ72123.1 hypothetical protein MUN79_26745 [Hymenobacter cellulosilyticus]